MDFFVSIMRFDLFWLIKQNEYKEAYIQIKFNKYDQ